MNVLVTTSNGKELQLSVINIKEPSSIGADSKMISTKGINVAQDISGEKLLDLHGKVLDLGISSRSGQGIFKGVECSYVISGYLND